MNNLDLFLEFGEVKQKYFSSDCHRLLFRLLSDIYRDGAKDIDAIDVYSRAELYTEGQEILDSAGGVEYISTLQEIAEDDDIETTKNHAKTIIDCAFKRALVSSLNKAIDTIESKPSMSANQVDTLVEGEFYDLKSKFTSLNEVKRLGDIMGNLQSQIEKERQDGFTGFSTFSPRLNDYFTYRRGELVVIAAKAKTGKSFFCVNEVYNLGIVSGIPLAILDTELSTKTFYLRLLARTSGVSIRSIETGDYLSDPQKTAAVDKANKLIEQAPIYHHYIPDWTNIGVENMVKKLRIQANIQILFFDYIKASEVQSNGVAEHAMLGNITIFLKNLAGKLNIPIVAFAQQSPYTDGGLRIADSHKVERYASTIAFFVRKNQKQFDDDFQDVGGSHYIYISHNRNGECMDDSEQDKGVNIDVDFSIGKLTEARYQSLAKIEFK